MIRDLRNILIGAAAATLSVPVMAAVTADEAKQLGTTLTMWGAEVAGNKEGTIPAYSYTPIHAPAGWNPKEPTSRVDPWNDKILLTITAQNADKYADKLGGLLEVFKKYPDFKMNVYPTRRTATYPKYVLDNTLKNATSCKATEGENILVGCYGGLPFPIPKTGAELMWNHLLSYGGHTLYQHTDSWIVPTSGNPVLTDTSEGYQIFPMYDPKRTTPFKASEVYWGVRMDTTAPARAVGNKLILLDHFDGLNHGRRAYQYIPGQRRVKLAPDLSYDTPSPVAGGAGTMDDGKVFLGPINRYNWEMVGKKERFMLYNTFKLIDHKQCPPEVVLTKRFPNPDCLRWELHRTWVVKGTLKPEFRHIYKTRIYYWDEDQPGAGTGETYDASGALWRILLGLSYPFYAEESSQHNEMSTDAVIDLVKGVWSFAGLISRKGLGYYPASPRPKNFYTPEALAGEGIR